MWFLKNKEYNFVIYDRKVGFLTFLAGPKSLEQLLEMGVFLWILQRLLLIDENKPFGSWSFFGTL